LDPRHPHSFPTRRSSDLVDLKGTALCMKYEIRQLLAQGGGGSIINISSVSGFRPQPQNIAYVAAKHGVVGMTKVAALEYGAENIDRKSTRLNSSHVKISY